MVEIQNHECEEMEEEKLREVANEAASHMVDHHNEMAKSVGNERKLGLNQSGNPMILPRGQGGSTNTLGDRVDEEADATMQRT